MPSLYSYNIYTYFVSNQTAHARNLLIPMPTLLIEHKPQVIAKKKKTTKPQKATEQSAAKTAIIYCICGLF